MKFMSYLKLAFGIGAIVEGVLYSYQKAGRRGAKTIADRRYDNRLEEAFSTSDAVASY